MVQILFLITWKPLTYLITPQTKKGIAIRTDADREDTRPLFGQLSFDNNAILTENPALKSQVTSLPNKHKSLWSHIDGKRPYGSAQNLEIEINLIDPLMKPIKQKPRIYIELQQKSLQLQIEDWEKAGKIIQCKSAPSDAWISNFHPAIKPQHNAPPPCSKVDSGLEGT